MRVLRGRGRGGRGGYGGISRGYSGWDFFSFCIGADRVCFLQGVLGGWFV